MLYYEELLKKAVAPLVGAWIETFIEQKARKKGRVAPLVGAWIETVVGSDSRSLP